MAEIVGPTEMPYERERAAELHPHQTATPDDLTSRIQRCALSASRTGADLATTRRIAESTNTPGARTQHLVEVLDQVQDARLGYLWNLQVPAATPARMHGLS